MNSPLVAAIAQYAPLATTELNVEAMQPLVREAVDAGAQLVVFPEYSQAFSHGLGSSWSGRYEALDGPFVQALSTMSSRHGGIVVVAGMLAKNREEEKPLNTLVAVGPSGLLASASKIHLYDAFGAGESRWVSPASPGEPALFRVGNQVFGMLACYDLRFPEVSRRLVEAGATTLIVPAQWVPGAHKVLHWESLLRARAIESQAFVLASGHPEPEGVGHSMILDPWGETLASLGGQGHAVTHATLEMDTLTEIRALNPLTTVRRFSIAWDH